MKIDHIAIVVKDADQAAKTYRDMFGFEVTATRVTPSGEAKVVNISGDGITLELFEPLKEGGRFAFSDFLRETGGGLHHISVTTDDIEGDFKKLKAQGRKLQSEAPEVLPFGKMCFVEAGDEGVLIEIMERNQ